MILCWNCKKETGISIDAYGDHNCPYCQMPISVYEPNVQELPKEDKPKTSYEDWQDKKQQQNTERKISTMIYEEIFTKKVYQKDGADKVVWLKCGTLRINDTGKKFIELNHLPDVTFFVFPKKEKTSQPEQAAEQGWLSEEQQG